MQACINLSGKWNVFAEAKVRIFVFFRMHFFRPMLNSGLLLTPGVFLEGDQGGVMAFLE